LDIFYQNIRQIDIDISPSLIKSFHRGRKINYFKEKELNGKHPISRTQYLIQMKNIITRNFTDEFTPSHWFV